MGGTHTNAVIMDTADRIIAKAKAPCTPDITGGIIAVIDGRPPLAEKAATAATRWMGAQR